jgi:hypothetical protein
VVASIAPRPREIVAQILSALHAQDWSEAAAAGR